jgi:hypothetical protein
MFEELISKYVFKANGGTVAKKQADAKYVVYVKTVNTDPGWNAVVMKRNPKCVFEISVDRNSHRQSKSQRRNEGLRYFNGR